MWDRVYVVGIGADGVSGLTPRAAEILKSADLLVGTERLHDATRDISAERLIENPGKASILDAIDESVGRRRVVVLASGDPGFFGVARVLVRRLGKDRVEVVPHVSSVQLAFARIKESWEDVTFLSVHGRTLEGLSAAVSRSHKVAILTDESNSPAAVARTLLADGVDGFRAFLCEDLGGPQERVREADLATIADMESHPLSLLILLRRSGEGSSVSPDGMVAAPDWGSGDRGATDPALGDAWSLGILDDELQQRKPRDGLITKQEVRVISLAKLGLHETSTVWDVGAGSGAVAIEAAMLARRGHVHAVERDAASVELIRRNVARFGIANLSIVHGVAPEALEQLPRPDAVFVGGSGGRLAEILRTIAGRLSAGGRIVVNAGTLETAAEAVSALRKLDFSTEATLVQVSRGQELKGHLHFRALNPVFVVAGLRADGLRG